MEAKAVKCRQNGDSEAKLVRFGFAHKTERIRLGGCVVINWLAGGSMGRRVI